MALQHSETPTSRCWRAQPNHTLQPHLARWLLCAAALVAGGIALVFAYFGAWLVLPFAGLEVVALWLGLRYFGRHAVDEEEIYLDRAQLRVISTSAGEVVVTEFQAYWAQVQWHRPTPASPAGRLLVGSHGRSVEIGKLLTGGQKQALAVAMRQQLQAWRTGAATEDMNPE